LHRTMSKLKNLRDLYIEQLQDLYSAETQLVRALPAMARAADDETLRSALREHLDQTKIHVQRLERIFENMNCSPKRHTCKAMKGLIAEGKEMLTQRAEPAVRDAGIIAAAQRIEHYEMAGYGCVRTYAEILGENEAAE